MGRIFLSRAATSLELFPLRRRLTVSFFGALAFWLTCVALISIPPRSMVRGNLALRTKISDETRCTCQSWPDQVMRKVPQDVNEAIKHSCVKLLGSRPRWIAATEIRIHRTRHWNVNILPFARMSWPPSPCSNRLWEDGAKCSGIMLVLCDKTGGFYYKPTIVEPVFEKELKYKLCAFLLPHTENKWLLIQGTQTFSHTISLVLSFLFLSYRPPQNNPDVSGSL